jgi:hypothetical protein
MTNNDMTDIPNIDVLLDEYRNKIIHQEDIILFDEVVKSTRVESIRLAYIGLWLTCAESLKRKFREAQKFDNEVGETLGKIEEKEQNKQSIDTYLIEEARKYGFISEVEFTHLKYVYDNRCIYGHPYEQAPTINEFFIATGHVVTYVLSRPFTLGNGFWRRELERICSDRNYLADSYNAVAEHVKVLHKRLPNKSRIDLLRSHWQKWKSLGKADYLFVNRFHWFTIAFLNECDDDIFSTWKESLHNDFVQYPCIHFTIASVPTIFQKIGQLSQDYIIRTLISNYIDGQFNVLKIIDNLKINNCLSPDQLECFRLFLTMRSLVDLTSAQIDPNEYIERVITELKSHNWYQQNAVIQVVKNMEIKYLSPQKQVELGNNILQSAEGDARRAKDFILDMSQKDKKYPKDFIKGIIAECFVNERGKLRFKIKYLKEVCLCLLHCSEDDSLEIIQGIIKQIKTSSTNNWHVDMETYNEAIAIIQYAMEYSKLSKLDQLEQVLIEMLS